MVTPTTTTTDTSAELAHVATAIEWATAFEAMRDVLRLVERYGVAPHAEPVVRALALADGVKAKGAANG